MLDAFRIEPPFLISFSGGRTSGYLLRRVLDAYGGTLPVGGEVMFANTGREHPATLEFVNAVSKHWCRVRWIEYTNEQPNWREVTYETASRNGEPFAALIAKRKYLPNPVTRFCTSDLKVIPMRKAMRALGHEEYTTILGIRADEPRRVAKLRGDQDRDIAMPLADDGITSADVLAWWELQPFNLSLPNNDPAFGNCDLCFLKGSARIERVIRHDPSFADWWIEQEQLRDARFRKDRPTYRQLRTAITIQGELFRPSDDDHTIPCECTD